MGGLRALGSRRVAALAPEQIGSILQPFFPDPQPDLLASLSAYLDLLLRWNARTNLTAIRAPEEIVRRHFGESLFLARHLPPIRSLLDFGSGAGFPGIPVQLARPEVQVTLAESQHKKVAFLREAIRTLEIGAAVWPSRVDALPPDTRFDAVALRAVDDMKAAMSEAARRVTPGGWLAVLTTGEGESKGERTLRIPGSEHGLLSLRQLDSQPVFHVEHSPVE